MLLADYKRVATTHWCANTRAPFGGLLFGSDGASTQASNCGVWGLGAPAALPALTGTHKCSNTKSTLCFRSVTLVRADRSSIADQLTLVRKGVTTAM